MIKIVVVGRIPSRVVCRVCVLSHRRWVVRFGVGCVALSVMFAVIVAVDEFSSVGVVLALFSIRAVAVVEEAAGICVVVRCRVS